MVHNHQYAKPDPRYDLEYDPYDNSTICTQHALQTHSNDHSYPCDDILEFVMANHLDAHARNNTERRNSQCVWKYVDTAAKRRSIFACLEVYRQVVY